MATSSAAPGASAGAAAGAAAAAGTATPGFQSRPVAALNSVFNAKRIFTSGWMTSLADFADFSSLILSPCAFILASISAMLPSLVEVN